MQGLQELLLLGSLHLEYLLVIGMLFAGCLLQLGSLLLEYHLLVEMLFAGCLLQLGSLPPECLLEIEMPFAECLLLPENLSPEYLLAKSLSVAMLQAEKFSQPEPLVTMPPVPLFQMSMRFRTLGPALRRAPRSLARHILVFVDNGHPIPQISMLFSWRDTRIA